MNLDHFGWNTYFHHCFLEYDSQGYEAARVAGQERDRYTILTKTGALPAQCSGRFRYNQTRQSDFPGVGDWVAVTCAVDRAQATIHHVLPRSTALTRKVAGPETDEQILAANIDTVILMSGLDGEFNLRRIERYLLVALQSNAAPVIALNKSDLCQDVPARKREAESIAGGIPVHAVSVHENLGLESLENYFKSGQTTVILGSSGVGKSSLVNRLLGEDRQLVKEIRVGDSRGRHTTTTRELLRLPNGALIIDTPGIRELQFWSGDEELSETFEDIKEMAHRCRFSDCRHDCEPGCAVLEAVEIGTLPSKRLGNYRKFIDELRFIERRKRQRATIDEKTEKKRISKTRKRLKHEKGW